MIREGYLKYVQYEKRFSGHTLRAYRSDLEQFYAFLQALPEISQPKNEGEITHRHIRAWVVYLSDAEMGNRSIARKLSVLKSYFKYLKKRGICTENPTDLIIAPKVSQKLPVFLTVPEAERLLNDVLYTNDFGGIRDRLALELLYATGIRRAELINLSIRSVDFSRKLLNVTGKGNKQRQIPLSNALCQRAQRYISLRAETFPHIASEELLLTDKGKPVYPKFIYDMVKKRMEMAGVGRRKSPHVMRHTCATHLLDNGADLNAVKELLGHAGLTSTQVYTHNTIEKMKKAYSQAHPKSGK